MHRHHQSRSTFGQWGTLRPGTDIRPLIVFGIGTFLCLLFVRAATTIAPAEQLPRARGFLLMLVLIFAVTRVIFLRNGRLILDPFKPESFYSLFFAVYYVFPFL